jgi:orotidine-5'-phosphate decarboxylase
VLALTSNKEGPEVQEARVGDGTVADVVLDHLRALNDGAEPLGDLGAVVGATIDPGDHRLDFNGPILAPGYGAQGGTLADLHRIFGPAVRHVLPTTSRELLGAGPAGLADAADRLNDHLRELLG